MAWNITKRFLGIPDDIRGDRVHQMQMPTSRHYECDASAADKVVEEDFQNCRYIYADVEGLAKITYRDDGDGCVEVTEVMTVGTTFKPVRHVVRVWNDVTTAEYYDVDGDAVVGIKLRR